MGRKAFVLCWDYIRDTFSGSPPDAVKRAWLIAGVRSASRNVSKREPNHTRHVAYEAIISNRDDSVNLDDTALA
jgi:hypothetical protein